MKKWILTLLTLTPIIAFAQESAKQVSFWDDPISHPLFPLYMLTAAVFVVLLLIMMVAIYIIKILNLFARRAAEEKAIKEGKVYVPEPTWWDNFVQRMNASVPV